MGGVLLYVIAAVFIVFGLISVVAPRRVVNFNRTQGRNHRGIMGGGPLSGERTASFQVGVQAATGAVVIIVGIAIIVWHATH